MNRYSKIAAFFLGAALVTGGASTVHAVTPGALEKAPQQSGAVTGQAKVQKITGVIKKMDGDTLLLENKRKYSLTGVKVVDLGVSAPRGKVPATRRLAEMTFVNNRLTEVVLR